MVINDHQYRRFVDKRKSGTMRPMLSLISVFILCFSTASAIAANDAFEADLESQTPSVIDSQNDAEPQNEADLAPAPSEIDPPASDETGPPPAPIEVDPPVPSDESDLSPPVTETEPTAPSSEGDLSPPPAEPAPQAPPFEVKTPTPPAVSEPINPPVEDEPNPTADDQVDPIPASTPTEAATETPTPTETPEPTPTAEPAIPFDPELSCIDSAGSKAPIQGGPKWSYLDCEITWATTDVTSVSLLPIGPEITWDIVALNDRAIQSPDKLILSPQPLDLLDATPGDDAFDSSRFHLAMRVSCVDETVITVPLKFRATSGENSLKATATERLPLSAAAATLPAVTLTSAVFEDVSPPEGTDISTGAITMNYTNASESCGWKITTNVEDFVAGEDVLPSSELSLVDVAGPAGLTSSIADGEITLLAAPGVIMPATGSITINVSMPVPETVSSGVYSTTITADAGAP